MRVLLCVVYYLKRAWTAATVDLRVAVNGFGFGYGYGL
jgi:hypothetical protein